MHDARTRAIARAETSRWVSDGAALVTGATGIVLAVGLTFLAVAVGTNGAAAGSGGVELQTDGALTPGSSDAELASLAQSAVTLVVPLISVVIGTHFAGAEMASGALLHIAVASRRLRLVFLVRAASLIALSGGTAALTALAASGAADIGARAAGLQNLTVSGAIAATVGSAVTTAVVLALLAFSLAWTTRRSAVVLLGLLAYLVVIEPVLTGAIGAGSDWLPRTALIGLAHHDAQPLHVVPTVAVTSGLLAMAWLRARRDRAA